MSNATDQARAISEMTTAEKLAEVEALTLQLAILRDQDARAWELRGLIRAGEEAIARFAGTVGRRNVLAMVRANVDSYRFELAELEGLRAA